MLAIANFALSQPLAIEGGQKGETLSDGSSPDGATNAKASSDFTDLVNFIIANDNNSLDTPSLGAGSVDIGLSGDGALSSKENFSKGGHLPEAVISPGSIDDIARSNDQLASVMVSSADQIDQGVLVAPNNQLDEPKLDGRFIKGGLHGGQKILNTKAMGQGAAEELVKPLSLEPSLLRQTRYGAFAGDVSNGDARGGNPGNLIAGNSTGLIDKTAKLRGSEGGFFARENKFGAPTTNANSNGGLPRLASLSTLSSIDDSSSNDVPTIDQKDSNITQGEQRESLAKDAKSFKPVTRLPSGLNRLTSHGSPGFSYPAMPGNKTVNAGFESIQVDAFEQEGDQPLKFNVKAAIASVVAQGRPVKQALGVETGQSSNRTSNRRNTSRIPLNHHKVDGDDQMAKLSLANIGLVDKATQEGVSNSFASKHSSRATEQVINRIQSTFRLGVTHFRLVLDPPELGRVDVKLSLKNDGNAIARIVVDNPEAMELLHRDLRGLERALANSGFRSEVEVSLRQDSRAGMEFSQNFSGEQSQMADFAGRAKKINDIVSDHDSGRQTSVRINLLGRLDRTV